MMVGGDLIGDFSQEWTFLDGLISVVNTYDVIARICHVIYDLIQVVSSINNTGLQHGKRTRTMYSNGNSHVLCRMTPYL